jgi:IS5 family transposase
MVVEGTWGQGKRQFGLGRLMAKLAVTSEAMIQVSFLVMNLEYLLARGVFSCLPSW